MNYKSYGFNGNVVCYDYWVWGMKDNNIFL